MAKIRAGIINVTGYAGIELARLLHGHPNVELVSVTGRSAAGQKLAKVFPHLVDITLTIEAELGEVDFVFSAMPHKASAEVILPLIDRGVKVVDISADFRLKDTKAYPQWYDFEHPRPQILQMAVYGLPELHRERISKAKLVANPGCYPTGALLALAPIVKEGLASGDIIVDGKSGLSGAGRSLTISTHYAEAVDNVRAYSLEGHRHLPEIVQELETLKPGFKSAVTFLPHIVPMSRGILSSCYIQPVSKVDIKKLRELYHDFYKGEPFARVVDSPPETKHTWGSNACLVYTSIEPRTGKIIIISCIDNMVKGAAGQAIQNMNIMLCFPETAGLEALPVYP